LLKPAGSGRLKADIARQTDKKRTRAGGFPVLVLLCFLQFTRKERVSFGQARIA